jgi:hypothetical protein
VLLCTWEGPAAAALLRPAQAAKCAVRIARASYVSMHAKSMAELWVMGCCRQGKQPRLGMPRARLRRPLL